MRRVVITGIGFLSSLGPNAEATWRAMLDGRTGIGPLRRFQSPDEPVQIAAEADLAAMGLPPTPPRHASRSEHLSLLALEEALKQADPNLTTGDPRRRGVFQGAATTGLPVAEIYLEASQKPHLDGPRQRATELVFQHPCHTTDRIAERIRAMGPRSTIMNACSSSLLAIGQAWERIATRELDLAIAGGAEALCHTTFGGFSSLKAMDPRPCRPFSRDRAGMNLGEAAVHLVLEPLELAQARGAIILGEVLGYGVAMDAHHATAPHPEGDGASRAMEAALRVAHLYPQDVDLISAHATATPANDGAEAIAIQRVLRESAHRVSVTASKSQFGHTLAAAGAVGAATALMALRDQIVSPTLRLEEPDPVCQLDCTPLIPRERRIQCALVNAFAFGGNNVSLALRGWFA
jgi:3-oxoacyl-[acyl-carrier-protein] synthase II